MIAGIEHAGMFFNIVFFITILSLLIQGTTVTQAAKWLDMLVWASKDGKFGYSKVSFGKDGEVTIALNKKPGDVETIALDIIPPLDGSIPAEVTPEQKEANAKRLLEEDAIQ